MGLKYGYYYKLYIESNLLFLSATILFIHTDKYIHHTELQRLNEYSSGSPISTK